MVSKYYQAVLPKDWCWTVSEDCQVMSPECHYWEELPCHVVHFVFGLLLDMIWHLHGYSSCCLVPVICCKLCCHAPESLSALCLLQLHLHFILSPAYA